MHVGSGRRALARVEGLRVDRDGLPLPRSEAGAEVYRLTEEHGMLTGEGCSRRQQRLWSAVPADIDWLLVGDARHICWLTGFWVRPLSFSAGEHSLLLLSREGKSTLFADNFVRRSAASEPYVTEEVTPRWYDHRHSVGSRERLLADAFAGVAGKLPASTGWIEREAVPYSLGGDLPAGGNLGDVIRRLRRSKDDDEVALLRSCMRAGAAGQARAFDVVRPGITEFEVYCQVQDPRVSVRLHKHDCGGNRHCQPVGRFRCVLSRAGGRRGEARGRRRLSRRVPGGVSGAQ